MGLFPEEFRAAHLRLTLRLDNGASFPEYLGPTLRGGFGRALHRVACRNRGGDCRACGLFACAYRTLFESPGTPDVGKYLQFERVPHPLVLEAPFPHQGEYAPGSVLEVGVVVIGEAVSFLPEVLESFVLLGRLGLGRPEQTFSVEGVQFRRGAWPESFVPWRGGGSGPDLIGVADVLAAVAKLQRGPVEIQIRTPLRIKAQGTVRDFTGGELCWAAARRVWGLAELYCGAVYTGQLGAVRGLLDLVRVSECQLRWAGWVRFSKRQNASLALSGFTGSFKLKAVPAEVLPFLVAGSLVHVGKHTLFGLGRYDICVGATEHSRGRGREDRPASAEPMRSVQESSFEDVAGCNAD